jgi:hypothetical protein
LVAKSFFYNRLINYRYREVFAQDRESKDLNDPYLNLVDAHENLDIFKIIKETPEEAAYPRVFPVPKELKRQAGDQCIVDGKEFDRNFDVFTEAQLRFLNWNNVFAAGGAVLNALLPLPKEHAESNFSNLSSHNLHFIQTIKQEETTITM